MSHTPEKANVQIRPLGVYVICGWPHTIWTRHGQVPPFVVRERRLVRGILWNFRPYDRRVPAFAAALIDRCYRVEVTSSAIDHTVLIEWARNTGGNSHVWSPRSCAAVHIVANDGSFGSGWGRLPGESDAVPAGFLMTADQSGD